MILDVIGRSRTPKSLDNISGFLEVMICGIINHALNVYELIVIPENYSHNSSLTMTILHDHLVRHLSSAANRPHHLQLQLDNSGKDNKNWYMIGYCGVSGLSPILCVVSKQKSNNIQLRNIVKSNTFSRLHKCNYAHMTKFIRKLLHKGI